MDFFVARVKPPQESLISSTPNLAYLEIQAFHLAFWGILAKAWGLGIGKGLDLQDFKKRKDNRKCRMDHRENYLDYSY